MKPNFPASVAKKRRLLSLGQSNKKARLAIKSLLGQGQHARLAKVKAVSFSRSTFGPTGADVLSGAIVNNRQVSARNLNREMTNAAALRHLNSGHLPLSNKDASQLMGNFTSKIMDSFSQNVAKLETLQKRTRKPFLGKGVSVAVKSAQIPEKFYGRRPDLVIRIADAKLPGVDFVPLRIGSLVDARGFVLDNQLEAPRKDVQRFSVMGWILFSKYIPGKDQSYHALYYLKKR